MKNYIIIAIIFIFWTGCSNPFETVLEVDPPPHKDQLVTSAIFTNQDSSLLVGVVKSVALLDERYDSSDTVSNCTIELFKGAEKVADFSGNSSLDPFGGYYVLNYAHQPNQVEFLPGETYTISVNHPDFPTATSTAMMPETVELVKKRYIEGGGIVEDGQRRDRIEVEFNDPAGVENYYEFAAYAEVEYTIGGSYINSIYAESLNQSLFEGFSGSYILSDETFDGRNFQMDLDFYPYFQDDPNIFSIKYYLIWRTVSKDYYRFVQSAKLQSEAEDFGPFSAPVTINSNFEDGLGIFALKNEQVILLDE